MASERRQRIIRTVGVIGIAIGAGHIAQSTGQPKVRFASLLPDMTPASEGPKVAEEVMQVLGTGPSAEALPFLPDHWPSPAAGHTAPALPKAQRAENDCAARLLLQAEPGAMIAARLLAPCRPGARVVLRHAALSVTYATDSDGVLAVLLPGLETEARVSVLFAGGETAEAALALPEAAQVRRFGVQWQGPRAFGLHAFEDGAGFGGPGHVSAARPGTRPGDAAKAQTGFLTALGDDGVEMPMLAEVYTFPAAGVDVPLVVEAAITPETCGREILGETLDTQGGAVRLADLSVTMPGCDAAGDYLVLKNLVPNLTVAAAN